MTEIVCERPLNYITFFRFLSTAGISLNSDIMQLYKRDFAAGMMILYGAFW
jgi:hypothetical protein